MADMLRPRLDRLQELAKQVNAETDAAGKIVQGVESYLSDTLHLGVRASITIESEEDQESFWSEEKCLVYGRLGKRFRIFVTETVCDGVENRDYREILWDNCARDVKLLAFSYLPALLDELVDSLERTLEQVKTNTETIQSLLPIPAKGKAAKS